MTTGPFDSRMATADGTDARVLAGVIALTAVVVPVVGLTLLSGVPFEMTSSTLVPLLLAAAGFMVVALVVDPVLTPNTIGSRDEVHLWLSKLIMARQPVIELPVLIGLLVSVIEQERSVLLIGALASLVLAMLWWPGEQFFSVMRRRLQPLSADHYMDELLNATNGRLLLRTR